MTFVVFCAGTSVVTALGCSRFQAISGSPNTMFDSKTAQNCWTGGPGQRFWAHHQDLLVLPNSPYSLEKTVDPPHIPTCASLKADSPVMADSVYTDIYENQ
jgi:hypothetical protein